MDKKNTTPKLTLIRGIPGSGKSTLAKKMASQTPNTVHFETDDFFMLNGEYHWSGEYQALAHHVTILRTQHALDSGFNVVVANVFSQTYMMRPYIEMAANMNVPIEIVKCTGNYKDVHNVPPETLQKMRDRWQDMKGEKIAV